jgi:hypothetical protein
MDRVAPDADPAKIKETAKTNGIHFIIFPSSHEFQNFKSERLMGFIQC